MLLIPCFWHSRIQAGDLSSHIYNAWLVIQLEHRPVPGLAVVPQWTNVLFDWLLTELMVLLGPDAAQRIAVSASVLIFFWGSLFFVRAIAQKPVWWQTPALAMLSYGWLFHSGFFNFYLSLGICLFMTSLWLSGRRVVAIMLLPIACTAHLLPVIWACGAVVFLAASRRFPRYSFFFALALLVTLSFVLRTNYLTLWWPVQAANMTGFEQLDIFGPEYLALVLAVLLVWGVLFRRDALDAGRRAQLARPELQLLALLSLSMLIIPTSVSVPGKNVLLAFLPNRLSITVALCALAVVGRVRAPNWVPAVLTVCMLVFGVMLHHDTGIYNNLEDRLNLEIDRSARGQKLVIAAKPVSAHINLTNHMIDRACVGKCFSYANYEPSTQVFRLRTTSPNALVISDYDHSVEVQAGEYTVTAADLPLLQANICGTGQPIRITPLQAGQIAGSAQCPAP
jgi:hypothetical protein